ncbi:MAG: HAMP domain-containing histidine kinase [Clostridia bacterium]|nr:HAMP domain-containing histidine kinase [Clostridia bacterium]
MKKEFIGITALWFRVVIPILVLFNSISSGIGVAVVLLHQGGFIDVETLFSPLSLAFFTLGKLALDALCAYLIGKKLLAPFDVLNQSLQSVSSGSFSTKIEAKTKIPPIDEMYENFNRMAEELQNTEILRSDFVANVSHEFKTPLTAIEGYAMLLQRENIPKEKQEEYLKKIIDNAKNLSVLTGSILRLSKLEQKAILKKTTFSLDEQIREVIVCLETEWEKKEIEFRLDLPSVSYTGDKELLFEVWYNLLSNAIKFSGPNGTIGVTLEEKDTLQVTVSDEGIGMDEETQKRIFEKFYQGDKAHSQAGNGLGLAIVKKIISLSGGTIEVSSAPNKGSTFTVRLP